MSHTIPPKPSTTLTAEAPVSHVGHVQGLGWITSSPPRQWPQRPRTGNRFSDSPETPPKRPRASYQRSTSFKTGSANHPIASASTNHSHDVIRMTARYERSGRRDANHIDTMPPETRQGRSYRPLCAALCPRLNVHTALCCLTLTTPRTTRRGELSSDPCSLGISVQGQPLHPRLDNLPQGLDNLGVHTCRAPPRWLGLSTG